MVQGVATAGSRIGRRALVIGAGVGGLAAARALADSFDEVIVLEQDSLPAIPIPRAGVPQGRHPHGLLAGAMKALEELFPGFARELAQAGAVAVDPGYDVLFERAGQGLFPRQRLGWPMYAMSRPLMELTLRKRVEQQRNITVRGGCKVIDILGAAGSGIVTGVCCETRHRDPDGSLGSERILADLVVDASAHGALTLAFLKATRRALPEETVVGIDTHYSSAVFASPSIADDFKIVLTYPKAPNDARYGYLYAAENNRWQVLLIGRGSDVPPADGDGFLRYAEQLQPASIYNAIKGATRVGEVARYGFPESVWRHFGRLTDVPRGLLPIGDAICRLNPVYGQGMTVALQEASMLHQMLLTKSHDKDPLASLGTAFLAKAESLIQDAWETSALPDLVYPETRGERPHDLGDKLKFRSAVSRIASRDPEFYVLFCEIRHLLKPLKTLEEPEIVRRVKEAMAAAV